MWLLYELFLRIIAVCVRIIITITIAEMSCEVYDATVKLTAGVLPTPCRVGGENK